MKIQTKAVLSNIALDDETISFGDTKYIDLEFSAIDTGGGFKDPILDFSFEIKNPEVLASLQEKGEITLKLTDPQDKKNETSFSYPVEVDSVNEQINGRLKEDQLSRALIGFVLKLLR